jgi:hypothetical protein
MALTISIENTMPKGVDTSKQVQVTQKCFFTAFILQPAQAEKEFEGTLNIFKMVCFTRKR